MKGMQKASELDVYVPRLCSWGGYTQLCVLIIIFPIILSMTIFILYLKYIFSLCLWILAKEVWSGLKPRRQLFIDEFGNNYMYIYYQSY